MNFKGIKSIAGTVALFPLVVLSVFLMYRKAKDQITPPRRDMWE